MRMRPVDSGGDILPVLSGAETRSGSEAAAILVQDRLSLLQGEWWENPSAGFSALEVLRDSRVTEADAGNLSAMISSYIRETPGVQEVEDVRFAVVGRRLSYSCTVRTKDGTAKVSYDAEF